MTIAEASKKYGLSIDTLRYYERMGLIPPVPRGKNGNRNYDEEAFRWIELIKYLRAAGIPVKTLARYVALCQQGESTAGERKQLLVQQRELLFARMEELQRTLQRLDTKIAYDEQAALQKNSPCRQAL